MFQGYKEARLDDEQNDVIKAIANLTSAKTAIKFIDAAIPLLPSCGIEDTQNFMDSVFENFDSMKPPKEIPEKDYGVRLYYLLRGSKRLVTEMLSCFCVVSPHSMTVERCVSTYNMLFSNLRMATMAETLIDRLVIHWKGVPTANFFPELLSTHS